jgi:hypothetical protein
MLEPEKEEQRMTPPWRNNVVGKPSDAELDRAAQAHVAQRREEIKNLVANPEVYDHRLKERGWREPAAKDKLNRISSGDAS